MSVADLTPIAAGLTPQQYRFVEEYCEDPSSQKHAAIRAGYAEANASSQASHMMDNPKIIAAIEQRQIERAKRLGITKDRVLQEIALIAFSNLQDLVEMNADGDTTINLKGIARDQAAALGEVSISTKGGKNKVKTAKIRLHDKLAALEKLAKHLGLLKDKVEHTGVLTLEQLVAQSMEEKQD